MNTNPVEGELEDLLQRVACYGYYRYKDSWGLKNCDDWTGIDEAKAKLLAWRSQGVGEAVDKARKDERQQVYYVAHDVLADLNIPRKEALQYFKERIAKEIQS